MVGNFLLRFTETYVITLIGITFRILIIKHVYRKYIKIKLVQIDGKLNIILNSENLEEKALMSFSTGFIAESFSIQKSIRNWQYFLTTYFEKNKE